jgi:non-canonical purine NTP pyrophosphatase (RdgB/HAM1 family)
MKTIHFATGNNEKIQIAQTVCSQAGIVVTPVSIEIDEIQGEDPELIVQDKVRRAYEQLEVPVVVSDDTWDIHALNGFPGAYMKSINHWFEPEDFIRLMSGVEDRRITLHQYLAFTDGKTTKVFKNDIIGKIIHEPRGKNKRSPNMTVTVLDSDNGKTIAEVFEQGSEAVVARYKNRLDAWHSFVDWYKNQ